MPRSCQSLVLSTWQTIDDWNRWFQHPLRIRLQQMMDPLLNGGSEYTLYRDIQPRAILHESF